MSFSKENYLLQSNETLNDFPRINKIVGKLIENDKANSQENQIAPTIWEQSWIASDPFKHGYMRGDAVWLNTDTIEGIVNDNMAKISSYVMANPDLRRAFMRVDKDNSEDITKFFIKVANGSAVPGAVSALYWVGDIKDCVQIMVSTKDYNTTFPDDLDSWRPVLSVNNEENQTQLMYGELNKQIDIRTEDHIRNYHIEKIPNGFAEKLVTKNPQTDFDQVNKYYFFSHYYTKDMNGFDFVKEFKYDRNNEVWYRQWNSGYLEQGGFVMNYGEPIIEVEFLKDFNFPSGSRFYQEGYDDFAGYDKINGHMSQTRRYNVTVTPVMGSMNENPYDFDVQDPSDTGMKSFGNVDVCGMTNHGFSFNNIDVDENSYIKYSWYASGFTTINGATSMNTLERSSFKVDFMDTLG